MRKLSALACFPKRAKSKTRTRSWLEEVAERESMMKMRKEQKAQHIAEVWD